MFTKDITYSVYKDTHDFIYSPKLIWHLVSVHLRPILGKFASLTNRKLLLCEILTIDNGLFFFQINALNLDQKSVSQL